MFNIEDYIIKDEKNGGIHFVTEKFLEDDDLIRLLANLIKINNNDYDNRVYKTFWEFIKYYSKENKRNFYLFNHEYDNFKVILEKYFIDRQFNEKFNKLIE